MPTVALPSGVTAGMLTGFPSSESQMGRAATSIPVVLDQGGCTAVETGRKADDRVGRYAEIDHPQQPAIGPR